MITIRQEQDVAVQENNHIITGHFHHQELSPRIIIITIRQEQDVAVQDNIHIITINYHQENHHFKNHQIISAPGIIMVMIRQEQDVAVQDNVRAVRGETAACPDRIILIILTEKAE